MASKKQRRDLLLDTALTLIAEKGIGGLSYRNLDRAAELPTGTASNYFRNRSELVMATVIRIHERLSPDPNQLKHVMKTLDGHERQAALLNDLIERVRDDEDAYVALLEVRLLARRDPAVRSHLLPLIRQNLQLSGEALSHSSAEPSLDFLLTYLTISGFLFEELTLPGLLSPRSAQDIIQAKLKD